MHAKNENTIPLSVIKAKSHLKISTSITKNTKIKNKYVCAYMLAPSPVLQSKHRLKLPFFSGFGPFRQHLVNSSWEAVKVSIKKKKRERSVLFCGDPNTNCFQAFHSLQKSNFS